MNKKEILSVLIDLKKAAILNILLNSSEELYLKEIATKSGVPIASVHRILQELMDLKIVQKKEWKTSKVYVCQENDHTGFLKELFTEPFDAVKEFVEKVKLFPEIETILLHGEQTKKNANLLLIGRNIDLSKIEAECSRLRQKGFELSYLTLTQEQYSQMSKMGLYSDQKRILK